MTKLAKILAVLSIYGTDDEADADRGVLLIGGAAHAPERMSEEHRRALCEMGAAWSDRERCWRVWF